MRSKYGECWGHGKLKKKGASGLNKVTAAAYSEILDQNLIG